MSIAGRIDEPVRSPAAAMMRRTVLNLVAWAWSLISLKRVRRRQWSPIWTRADLLLAGAAVALAAIAFSMVFLDAMTIAQQRNLPRWVIVSFESVTDFGRSGWVLAPIGALLVALATISSPALGRTSQLVIASLAARLGYVFLAVGFPGLVVTIAKRLIGRARPYFLETAGPFSFDPFRWNAEFASLPSGHGTTAFAAAFAIGALYPRARIWLWTFAALIAISRVAVSAHYPSDVLAGAVVGVFGALVVRNWFAVRRLAFVVAADRTVRPLPGPSCRRLKGLARQVWSRG